MTRFTETELAERWGITTRTLQGWRKAKKGPRFMNIEGVRIFYRMEDVLAYEEQSIVETIKNWRSPVRRAASALEVLANRAATPEAKKTLSGLCNELRQLLE